jgi:hypothetical protein
MASTRSWKKIGGAVGLVAAGAIAGGVIAGTVSAGADESPSSSVTADPSQPQRSDEELLTGDTATQVTEAVLAEYPDATIERVETDSGGVYEAHIITADDERLTVLVGENFEITGTESHGR